jgi:hypothetical protein
MDGTLRGILGELILRDHGPCSTVNSKCTRVGKNINLRDLAGNYLVFLEETGMKGLI